MNLPGLSYSMLSTAYQCTRKFQYLFIDRIKSGEPESGDMHFGTALHTGLNALLEGDNGLDVFNAYWNSEKGQERKYGRFGWDALSRQGQTFVERFQRLHLKKYKPFMMEQRMYGELAGVKVEGTPDFVGEYEGVPSLIDFKTSGSAYDHGKIITNPQMYLYAYLAKQALNYDVKQVVYVVFVKGNEPRIQVIQRELTPEVQSHMLSVVGDMLIELKERKQFPKNTNGCMMGSYRCNFFDHCWSTKESTQ